MKTFREKSEDIKRKWYLFDAEGKTLGRLATEIANILRGKNKVVFDRSQDLGDYVIVINAEKVVVTGKKPDQKLYRYHSKYPGSMKEITFNEMITKKPEKVIKEAVKGMLPHNKLSDAIIKKLKVYCGKQHPHQAQDVINVK